MYAHQCTLYRIENSILNRDSTQNLSALKISNVRQSTYVHMYGWVSVPQRITFLKDPLFKLVHCQKG